MAIHPTAVIDPKAELDPTVEVGAYAIVEGDVRVGAGTRIYHHAYLTGFTEIGPECEIHPFAIVGHLPQDFHFEGHRSYCRIGAGTVIREHATIHRGTDPESSTLLGEKCFLLAYTHVGHNCVLGDRVTLINGSTLGGHTEVGRNAVFSAGGMTHQFVRVGEYAMISASSLLVMDTLPFMTTQERNLCAGVNLVGMRRGGFTAEDIAEIRKAYKLLYRSGRPLSGVIAELEETLHTAAGKRLLAFLTAPSRRGLGAGPRHACRPSRHHAAE